MIPLRDTFLRLRAPGVIRSQHRYHAARHRIHVGALGSVLDVEMAILDKQSKGVAIDEQANDDVVHLYRLREADRLAD